MDGKLIIGSHQVVGSGQKIYATNAATGDRMVPAFRSATEAQLRQACTLAKKAFREFRNLSLSARAGLLDRIADNITALGGELIERAVAETGLPIARLQGETGRTIGQLRMFASVARAGDFIGARIDSELPDRQPVRRPDIRLQRIGLGPVAVFAASNFPLAFSVAGGDTASALAAGCPVIVKAHSAHPGTSEIIGRCVQQAVDELGLPEGVFSMLFGNGTEIGAALVAAPEIKAVGFTGSRQGGLALAKVASSRPEPIPVYAEMSSINPIVLMPAALSERAEEIADEFVISLAMGAGQFCTNPGLIIALDSGDLDRFVERTSERLSDVPNAPMLTSGIRSAYDVGVAALAAHPCVKTIAKSTSGAFFATSATKFLENEELTSEVFGVSSILVRCDSEGELQTVLENLEGQLTASMHIADGDHSMAARLVPILEEKAGRLIVNGFGTGVEVCHAMVHGGPFPATSDGRTTSVGSLAIDRFLRPVAYQDFPDEMLPFALRAGNPLTIKRFVDGEFQ